MYAYRYDIYIRFDSSIRFICMCVLCTSNTAAVISGSRSSNPVISSASSKSTEPPSASPLKSLAFFWGRRRGQQMDMDIDVGTIYIYIYSLRCIYITI